LPVGSLPTAMTCPLRSTSITPASSLLQGSPPLSGASVLSASRLEPLAPCMGLFLSRSFGTPAHLLHQFLCSIRKPFLRPDPRFAHVVARRSCQGWPSHQPSGMLRPCQARDRGMLRLAYPPGGGPPRFPDTPGACGRGQPPERAAELHVGHRRSAALDRGHRGALALETVGPLL
jgi:hypothetical protein